MGVIQSDAVVIKTTTVTLKTEDIKKLIAADMGVDPRHVSLKFDLSYDYNDYSGGGMTGATFSSIKVEVTERVKGIE